MRFYKTDYQYAEASNCHGKYFQNILAAEYLHQVFYNQWLVYAFTAVFSRHCGRVFWRSFLSARQISPEVPRTSLMGKVTASFDADGFWREFQWGLVPSAFRGGGALQRLLEKHNNSSGLEPESLVSGILARYTYYGHEVHIQNIFEACGEDGSFIEVFTREFLPRNIHGTPIQKAFSPGIFLTKVSISVYFPLKVLGAFLVALRGMSARVPFALEVGMGTAVWYRLGIAYIWLKAGLTNPGSSDSITQHYCQITIANF
ncbi:hypothetical protein D9757_011208 [Collybiopsis confluens]|uniref:Uncharacterized protein n=1 Tax=Collybiopsis confluens TaxID=2823264 RepID=A0A8H5H357_9AGAR|nr:hypothetical protein D9757_011208 [Collybiopsis confluens]